MSLRTSRPTSKYASAEDILDLRDSPDQSASERKLSVGSTGRTSSEDGSNAGSGFFSSHVMTKGGSSNGSGHRWRKGGKHSKRRFGVVSPPPNSFYHGRSDSGVESSVDLASPPIVSPPPQSAGKGIKGRKFEWFLGSLSPTAHAPQVLSERPMSYEEDLEKRVQKTAAMGAFWRDKWEEERKQKRAIKEERDTMVAKVLQEYEESCCQYESLVDRLRARLGHVTKAKVEAQRAFRVVVDKLARERTSAIQRAQRSEAGLSLAYGEIQEVKVALAELQQSKTNLHRTNESLLDQLHIAKDELKQVKAAARRDAEERTNGIAHALYRLCELENSQLDRVPSETLKAKRVKPSRRYSLEDERKAEVDRNLFRLQSTVQSALAVLKEHSINASDLFNNFLDRVLARESDIIPRSPKKSARNPDNHNRDHADEILASSSLRRGSVLGDLEEEPLAPSDGLEADRMSSTASSVADFYFGSEGRVSEGHDSQEGHPDMVDGWGMEVSDCGVVEWDTDRVVSTSPTHANGNVPETKTIPKESIKKRKGSKLKEIRVKGFAELFARRRRGERRHSHGNILDTDIETMSHISDASKDTQLSDSSSISRNMNKVNSSQSLTSLEMKSPAGESLASAKPNPWKYPDLAKVTLRKALSGTDMSDKDVSVSPGILRRNRRPDHLADGPDRIHIGRRRQGRSMSLVDDSSSPFSDVGKSPSRVLQWLKKKVKPGSAS